MKIAMTALVSIMGAVDMKSDPVVRRYAEAAADLGPNWGRVVVLDQAGRVVMGKRRFDQAVRNGEMEIPAVRVNVSREEARLLRLADFCEGDGLLMLTLERIVAGTAAA